MVNYCCVVGCKSSGLIEGIRFFSFPTVKKNCISTEKRKLFFSRKKAWFLSLHRKDLKLCDLNTRKICSKHFLSGKPAEINDVNNPDWVPSVDMGRTNANRKIKENGLLSNARSERCERRILNSTNASKADTSLEYYEDVYSSQTLEHDVELNDVSASRNKASHLGTNDQDTSNESTAFQCKCNNNPEIDVWAELQQRINELIELRKELAEARLTEEAFLNNEEKLRFYTALPNMKVFQLILSCVEKSLTAIKVKKLDNFQKLLITLMKLRLNYSFTDLGFRFGIRPDSASKVFKKVIIILYYAFEEFIVWPNREAAAYLMPSCFQRIFGNSVTVIVDCFEIPTQKPSTLKARVQSFSQYKQKHTVKYLIGITPHGVISFISKGYGGRVSDKKITQKSGILDKLIPGDVIMADRGFTISEMVAEHGAETKIPDFTKGASQLHPKAVENTRDIANVRIHVERIIGEIRNKFMIMNGPIPIKLLRNKFQNKRLLDYIVYVSCILINFCDAIIPIDK